MGNQMQINLKPELVGGHEHDYDEEIKYWSNQYEIPFALSKGLISVESAFNPKAYREEPQINDASRGLTQILLKTAREIGYANKPEDLFLPDTNLRWGLKFFTTLLNRQNYNVLDAVAAYNMGSPRPAAKTTPAIIKIYGQPGPDWTYANEPYVRRVMAHTAFYDAVENGDFKAAEALRDLLKKKEPFRLSTITSTREFIKDQRVKISIAFNWLLILNLRDQQEEKHG